MPWLVVCFEGSRFVGIIQKKNKKEAEKEAIEIAKGDSEGTKRIFYWKVETVSDDIEHDVG